MSDESPVVTKICKACCVDLPATENHFHRDSNSGDGWRHVCIDCRKLIDQKKGHERKLTTEQENYDVFLKLEHAGIDTLITAVGDGTQAIPHAAEVYSNIMHFMGGPRMFAQHLVALYHNPKSSPHIKTKILQDIIRLSSKISESGMLTRDLDNISTMDLERMLKERMQDALNGEYVKVRNLEYEAKNAAE